MQRTNSNYFKTHDRYLYQGSEMDKEVKGDGNSYTTTFRQLDPRLGRWMTIDPVIYSWQSPYCSMNNNPLYYNDILGLYGSEKTAKRKQRKAERKFGEDKVGDVYDRNKGKEGQKPNYGFQVFGEGKDDKTRVSLDSDGDPIASAYTPDAVIDNDKDLRNFTKRAQRGDWFESTTNVFNAAGIGGTAKTELIDFAVRDYAGLSRQSFNKLNNYSKTTSEVRALGTTGAKYLRYTKGLGVLGNVVGVTSAGIQLIENPTAGNATRLSVQGAAIGVAFIPVIGWGVSIGIGVADLIWGEDFYNWIDKH
jgi:RHS repeat-associated protein